MPKITLIFTSSTLGCGTCCSRPTGSDRGACGYAGPVSSPAGPPHDGLDLAPAEKPHSGEGLAGLWGQNGESTGGGWDESVRGS